MTSIPDPLDLPIFGSSPLAKGRVRSSFSFEVMDGECGRMEPPTREVITPEAARLRALPTLKAAPLEPRRVAPATPTTATAANIDWQAVARHRAEVARRLSDQMGEAKWEQKEQEAEGWTIIRKVLDEEATEALARIGEVRSIAEQEVLAQAVFDACFGLGRLQPLVDDALVENIMITGCDLVTVERSDGSLWKAAPVADSDDELAEFLAFLAARADNPRSFTPSQPSLHLTLPGGARLAAARDTARISVVIRRHRVREVTLDEMVSWGSLSPTIASFLRAAVRSRPS